MKAIVEISNFLQQARKRMRSGEASREPLLLLRVEWRGDLVECDWLMRAMDPWDRDLPANLATENHTLQALRDALKLRDMIFRYFPAVGIAYLRMFRADGDHRLELVMTGSVNRSDEILHRVPSVVMRARMCGFRFTMTEGAVGGMVSISV